MSGIFSPEKLARFSAQRPWYVLGIWVVLLAAGVFSAMSLGDVLTTEFKNSSNPDSAQADDLLEARLRGPEQASELVIVVSESETVDDPEFQTFVEKVTGDIRGLGPEIASATSFYETGDESLVSDDRRKTLIPVRLTGEVTESADNVAPLMKYIEDLDAGEFEVVTGGEGSLGRTFNELSERDAQRGESIGIPVALIILLLVFGAAVAAGVPLVLAVVSIVIALGVSALVGRVYEINFIAINVITMIGLAVGIDYALFIVQRFREERVRGLEKIDAIARAGATSGRAVLFSGGTVVVGLLGMTIVPNNIYRSIAIGTTAVAITAVLGALTLLPAILGLLGDKVNALRIPFIGRETSLDGGHGFWDRMTRIVTARPLISVALCTAFLVAAAIPYFTINPGSGGIGSLPEGTDSRRAFEILESDFTGGLIAPFEIVVDAPDVASPEVREGMDRFMAAIALDGWFGEPTVETNDAGDLALISVPPQGDPASDASYDAVDRLRDEIIPAAFAGVDANVLVTGSSAEQVDGAAVINQYTPYVFAFTLGLSFILLLIVFRSIVVPVKAIIMNLLSVGASYGLLVLVFQHGVGNEFFRFQQTETIEPWLPLFLFSIIFGLSMDYHVFLLSRIRERYDETRDNTASVAYGLRTTAALITGAALIMVAVFAGFAMGDLSALEQLGFGLAVAVILDATIIRTVLVPASMELLGDWNWYLPGWLRWLPDLRVEGGSAPPAQRPVLGEAAVGGGGD